MKEKKSKIINFIRSMIFNIIFLIVLLLLIFGALVGIMGYFTFTDSITSEYMDAAHKTAVTARVLVNGNKIEEYLENKETINERINTENTGNALCDEYNLSYSRMNTLCQMQEVALIYVISVDTSDYNSFLSVFNTVNQKSIYTPWEVGFARQTTNEEYRAVYRDIYENGKETAHIVRDNGLNGSAPHITTLVPVKNDDGKVTAILCVQRFMERLNDVRKGYIIKVNMLMVALALCATFFWMLIINRQFVMPIKRILGEAKRFSEENSAPEAPLKEKNSFTLEISMLASAIETMEDETLKYIENLTAAVSEKQRVGTELHVASMIQEGMIPTVFPPFPDKKVFDLHAMMTPAKEVGGDFYDYFMPDDDHLCFVVADVSGKGIPAALFMMVTKILIKERALAGGTPGEILSFVNKRICENNVADMFVTVWFGILDIPAGKISASNAGHDHPVIMHADGRTEILKTKSGPVIGAFEDVRFRDFEIDVKKSDKIFLYTDGLIEATNSDLKMFGMDAMIDSLEKARELSPKAIIDSVWEDVTAFVGDAPQFDDLTMLCLEYKYPLDDEKRLSIPAVEENLSKATEFVTEYLEQAGCSMKAIRQMEIAVEEIYVNISRYAYRPEKGDVDICLSKTDKAIIVTFIDGGREYDPLKKPDPDITLSAEEREIGGLGVFMAKKLSDNITYKYENGKNILILEKNLE